VVRTNTVEWRCQIVVETIDSDTIEKEKKSSDGGASGLSMGYLPSLKLQASTSESAVNPPNAPPPPLLREAVHPPLGALGAFKLDYG
jgi:hypothetical protein